MSRRSLRRVAIFLTIVSVAIVVLWIVFHNRHREYDGYDPPPRTKTSGCIIRHALPDPECTPGALDKRATKEIICARLTSEVRHTSKRITLDSFASYGVSRDDGVEREDDHLISLELGGADNDIANHFPQIYENRKELRADMLSDDELGAHAKDLVENWLHRRVCNDQLELKDAQRMIATDWVALYREYQERPKRSRHRDE